MARASPVFAGKPAPTVMALASGLVQEGSAPKGREASGSQRIPFGYRT